MREAQRERQLLARAANKLWNLRLRTAFDGWRDRSAHMVHARHTAAQMCARMYGRSALYAFNTWRAATDVMQRNREAAARVLLRVCKSNLYQVHQVFSSDRTEWLSCTLWAFVALAANGPANMLLSHEHP